MTRIRRHRFPFYIYIGAATGQFRADKQTQSQVKEMYKEHDVSGRDNGKLYIYQTVISPGETLQPRKDRDVSGSLDTQEEQN